MKKKIIALAIAFALSTPVWADDSSSARATPGSIWDSVGTSPAEKGNIVNFFHVDQGIVMGHAGPFEVTPYVAVNLTKDSQDLNWNNRQEAEIGVKLVKHYDSGQIDLGIAYGSEHRSDGDVGSTGTKSALMASANGWFGYNAFNRADTPGSVWFTIGNISPFEQDNVIAQARVDQGLIFAHVKSAAISGQAWAQGGLDTQGYAWNNKIRAGVGLRASVAPTDGSSASVTVGFECENSMNHCGPTVWLDLWAGWRNIKGVN